MKRAIVLAFVLVLGTATSASATARFSRLEASQSSYFGALVLEFVERRVQANTKVRIVVSAAERFKYQCWGDKGPTDEKYFVPDHLMFEFVAFANERGVYRLVTEAGPQLETGGHIDQCAGAHYPIMIRSCYDAITVLDIHREIGITWPDRECGLVTGVASS